MTRTLALALLVAVPFALAGCGGGDKDHKDHKDHSHKDHDHKDHTHKDETAKDKGGHKHEGEQFDLGSKKVGTYDVKVTQIGKITKGEGVLEIEVAGMANGVVRAWAGSADGKGAVKTKADSEDGKDFDVHVEVAEPLAADAKWWVELEPTGGEKVTASFDIKK